MPAQFNPLKCSGVRFETVQCRPGRTYIFNFWHSGKSDARHIYVFYSSQGFAHGYISGPTVTDSTYVDAIWYYDHKIEIKAHLLKLTYEISTIGQLC